MDYRNKKVVIFGLGSYKNGSGISAAIFLAKKGAKLLITDLGTKEKLAPQIKRLKGYKNVKYVLGKHREKDFLSADIIVKNPGVPKDSKFLKTAKEHGAIIENDWTLFLKERPTFAKASADKPDNLIIGITGTKGKSTTAALIYHLLVTVKKEAVLCGNIGLSPLSILSKIKKDTIIVAELSSWLLADFKTSPQIAVITNLMPEHLDKYKNVKEYYKDKKNIFKFQKPGDHLIQNKQGAKAALEVAKILKIPKTIAHKAIETFKGLPNRLEFVIEKNGVKYYNDTCATMPEATIYALHQLKKTYPEQSRRIILIAGGVDKKLNYKNLAKEIPKYCKALILFEGTASGKIKNEIEKIKNKYKKLKIVYDASSIKEVVKKAKKIAEKNDIILLSPGAASFNLFKNEFDRGKQFIKAI